MSVDTAESPKPGLVQRLAAQRERHRQRGLPVRMLYTITGFALLIAGLVMLILPGPALIVIPIGLAMLSLEFRWAEGLLERTLEYAERAKRKAQETSTTQRVLSGVVAALAVAGLAVWGVLGDIPLLPF